MDEEDFLEDTLRSIGRCEEVEVIVSDGGSRDATREIASKWGAIVLASPRGRGVQMNRGAEAASSDLLLFLHADTRVPDGYCLLIQETIGRAGILAGAFRLGIEGRSPLLRLVEVGTHWRASWLGLPYGDQGLFVDRQTFFEVGGFPPIPIMEDVELLRRIKRIGKVKVLSQCVGTSARRWKRIGPLRNTVLNQFFLAAYHLGVSPDTVARWYQTAGR